ncbi:Uncharacterised protein [Amycolatopsis camponoti]|uniref:SIR2-like domain-containing protein n=1 Tax=Amycolatopsis camponoti TaxID=2606593 RepID=A0A6I8LPG6_9PSEU|nr:SIR2 family protein [Amycolatopsis camponoti]VVJ18338.1 Uncharacterised protein [Amycolatopsis camponoti]
MWIRDVDFPSELITAHRSGELVIFVGAGASLDEPSGLPDFLSLTNVIAAEAEVPAPDGDDRRQLDGFLGRLSDQNIDVHQRVVAHIDKLGSSPNRLHEALAELAIASQQIRIVTTNYDLHISSALRGREAVFDEYSGPALPLGNDFVGLVYLHGDLRQEPRRLVVTDVDFGRAYLRDAWAARFLERMFGAYTVLFVGYSHSDVVMRYLARALGPGAARYILTDDPDAPNWRLLGLRPVGYPVVDGSHAALAEAIGGWATRASMGLLDHRRRIAELTSAAPTQIPEEESYLESVVADTHLVGLFTELARGREWLEWTARQPEFRKLFDEAVPPTDTSRSLAYWFAQNFVVEEGLTTAAFAVLRESHGRLGPTLCEAIGHALHMAPAPRPAWLTPWLVQLIENASAESPDWLEYALTKSRWPQDETIILLLFDQLTEPYARPQVSFGLPGKMRFTIELRGSTHGLDQAWSELFQPNLSRLAAATLTIVGRHLRRAWQLLATAESASNSFDPVSFGRSAIEPHSQDARREPIDSLIDAARDSLLSLLQAGHPLGAATLVDWADADAPLLNRLALHGFIHRPDLDSTEKIKWLRGKSWVYVHHLRHEVFSLLALALPDAEQAQANGLVDDIMAGPEGDGDGAEALRSRTYAQFNILTWVNRHRPDLEAAVEALGAIREQYPDFEVREHPDLVSSMTTGWVRPVPPMTTEELHVQIGVDVASVIEELRRLDDGGFRFEGPTWESALALIRDTVREFPGDGFAILRGIPDSEISVVGAVITGWSAALVSDDDANKILQLLTGLDLASVSESVSRMLSDSGQGETSSTEWHRYPAAKGLAQRLWLAIETRPADVDVEDWLIEAINNDAGRVALFWTRTISTEWRDAGDSWSGLDADTQRQLELMISGDDSRSAMAETVLGSQLFFFFNADRVWCEQHLLQLFDWSTPARARRVWDGFLIWGRWNDQLLDAGLRQLYLNTASNASFLRVELTRQLCVHAAAISLFSEADALEFARRFTANGDVALSVEWMDQVSWQLAVLPADAAESQWGRWIEQYWRGRIVSIPRRLSVKEASALAVWTLYLGRFVPEAVRLATASPAGLQAHSHILRKLDSDVLDSAPDELGAFLAHLMKHTEPPFWECRPLARIVRRLRGRVKESDINAVIAAALRLGCMSAGEW